MMSTHRASPTTSMPQLNEYSSASMDRNGDCGVGHNGDTRNINAALAKTEMQRFLKCAQLQGTRSFRDIPRFIKAIIEWTVSQFGVIEACGFIITCLLVSVGYHMISDGIFSSIVTLASVVQALGLVLTLSKVIQQRSFGTISIRSLQLYVPVYMMRLYCTLFNEGYLPIDRSGDWAYQGADVFSLIIVLTLLVLSYKDPTVHEERFPRVMPFCWSFILALFIHPCHNLGTWSDVTWTASVYLETFVMIPQLSVIARSDKVESLTSHSVACTCAYRGLNFWFWFVCRRELMRIRCPTLLPAYIIVFNLFLQCLFLIDFVFYYAKAVVRGSVMQLPSFNLDRNGI